MSTSRSKVKMLQSSKCLFVCLNFYRIHIAAHLTSVAHDLMYFRYIDPSYMIRSVPANATDTLYCMQLGQNAVHGTMAGYTGFSVGLCNNKMCLLPIPELVATSPRQMNPKGRTWCVCIVVS